MPMPTSSIGECEPDVTSPPPSIGMPCRGIAFSSITKATSLRSGPSALMRRRTSTPVELLVERAGPAEARGDRVGVRPDVVAVQRVADLEPQRVARAEPARDDAAREHRVPELRRRPRSCRAARSRPRPCSRCGSPSPRRRRSRSSAKVNARRRRQPEPLDRVRPLDGEQRVVVGDVAHVRAAGSRAP